MIARRTVLHIALVVLAIPVGLAAGWAARPALNSFMATPAAGPAVLVGTPMPLATLAAATLMPAPVDVRLQSTLLIGGAVQASAANGIALPSGTRFQVRVASAHSGTLELHAVNPDGVRSDQPLWSGWVDAGNPVITPMLRLEGVTGIENLQVVLRSPHGHTLSKNSLRIWHF